MKQRSSVPLACRKCRLHMRPSKPRSCVKASMAHRYLPTQRPYAPSVGLHLRLHLQPFTYKGDVSKQVKFSGKGRKTKNNIGFITNKRAAAVAVFDPQAEGWVFESQLRQTYESC